MATNPDSATATASPDPTKSSPPAPPVSRRPRPTLSCQPCRRKKLKCDRSLPCEQCKRTRRYNDCTYDYRPEFSGDPHYSEESEQRNKIPRLDDSLAGLPNRILAPAPAGGYADGLQTIEELQARVRRLEGAFEQAPQRSSAGRSGFDQTPSRHKETRPPAGAFLVKATRSRYHGPSHEINIFNQFTEAQTFIRLKVHATDSLRNEIITLQEAFPKKFQAPSPALQFDISTAFKKMLVLLPSRPICDTLVRIYGVNYEKTLRILHMPSFMEGYEAFWRMGDKESSQSVIVPQFMTMLVIALSLDDAGHPVTAASSLEKLIPSVCCDLVDAWVRGLSDKKRLETSAIQTQTLLLLAKQTIGVRAERLWLASGELTKCSMMMGLHRDPSEIRDISVFDAELHRRLWASVVELDLRISLACGMPTGIRENDFSTLPPSNLDDQELFPALNELPKPKADEQWSDTLMQIILAESLPLRLRAANLFNGGNYREAAYDEGVTIARDLEDLLETLPGIVRYSAVPQQSEAQPGRLLSRILLDVHIRRLLLNVLIPYTLRVTPQDDMHDFRKKCVESCLIMLSHSDALDPDVADIDTIYTRKFFDLFHTFCGSDLMLAGFCLCLEMKTMNELSTGSSLSDVSSPDKHSSTSGAGSLASMGQPPFGADRVQGSPIPRPPDQRHVTWTKAHLTKVVENTLQTLLLRIDSFGVELKATFRLGLVLQSLRISGSQERKDALMMERMRNIIKSAVDQLTSKLPKGLPPPGTSGGFTPMNAATVTAGGRGGGMNGGCGGGGMGPNEGLVPARPWEQQNRGMGLDFPMDMDFDLSSLNNPDFTVNWFLDQAWQ